MSADFNNRKTIGCVLAMLCGLSGSMYAGISACSGSYNLGTGTSGLLTGGTASAGCEQIDKEFTAFNYTPGTNPVAGSSVPVEFLGTAPTGPISVQFGMTATWQVSANGSVTTANNTYLVTVDPNPPAQYAPPAGESYTIDAVALGENASLTSGYPVGSNDSITLYEYFCGGGASACSGGSAATGGINLSAATAGFLVYTLTGNGNSYAGTTSSCFNNGNTNSTTDCAKLQSSSLYTTNSSLVGFLGTNYAAGFSQVYTYSTLSVNSGGDTTSLNYFTESFFQELNTPEPASFGLMGSALAALAFVGYRRRK